MDHVDGDGVLAAGSAYGKTSDGKGSSKLSSASANDAVGGWDRLSSLPNDVLILILRRLPAAAARTILLSRRWRNLWDKIPELALFLAANNDPARGRAASRRPRLLSPPPPCHHAGGPRARRHRHQTPCR
ncbi:hypothetical protein ABZP36_021584 [Zizania latifolia]